MHSFNLKTRIFAPLIFSGLVIFAIGFYIIAERQNREMNDVVYKLATSLQSHMHSIVDVRAVSMSASLSFIAHDEQVVGALRANDRNRLLALSEPIFRRLNQISNVTHLYFHTIDKTVLLRVHQPDRYGDVINRITLLEAEKTLSFSSGIEMGPLGTFTLRCVLPVFENKQLIGYVELGQEIEDIIHQTQDMFDIESFVLIKKQYLDRPSWEGGMTMLQRSFNWDQFANVVLISKSMEHEPSELLARVNARSDNDTIRVEQQIQLNERQYWGAIIPLVDAGGRQVASLVVLRNMTNMLAQSRTDLLLFIGIASLISLAVLIVFYVVLNRTEKQLVAAEQNLIEESRAKAQMQADFIRKLQDEHDKLGASEERIRLLLNSAGEGVFGLDLEGKITFINPAGSRMLGYDSDELLGQHAHIYIRHRHSDEERDHHSEDCPICLTLSDGQAHFIDDDVFWRKDASWFSTEYTCTPILQAGELAGAVVIFSDITLRKKAQTQIEQTLHIQRVLDTILNIALPPLSLNEVLTKSLDAVLSIPAFHLLNKGAIFLVANDSQSLELAAQRNLPDCLLHSCGRLPFGRCLCGKVAETREIIFTNHVDEAHEIRYDGMEEHGHYCLPILTAGKLLGVLSIYVAHGHVSDESERAYLKTVADTLASVIARKKADEALQQLAHHDMLTGLPNRILFHNRLDQTIALMERRNEAFFLLYLDLDHFKEINDTLGHDIGDIVLKETANRLKACARKADTVCRMGGDEFTVLLSDTMLAEHAASVAERIIKVLSQSFNLNGHAYRLGCSVGIAQYPLHGEDSEALIKHADHAMYQAKRQRNSYCFFAPASD